MSSERKQIFLFIFKIPIYDGRKNLLWSDGQVSKHRTATLVPSCRFFTYGKKVVSWLKGGYVAFVTLMMQCIWLIKKCPQPVQVLERWCWWWMDLENKFSRGSQGYSQPHLMSKVVIELVLSLSPHTVTVQTTAAGPCTEVDVWIPEKQCGCSRLHKHAEISLAETAQLGSSPSWCFPCPARWLPYKAIWST